jgi:hypothetical protein
MDKKITIRISTVKLDAVLYDNKTADAIWNSLPYEVQGSTWGDELYFAVPQELDVNLENGQDVVEVGDIGYWPIGNAFCIFYGPTPMSIDEAPRPASPVTVFGRVLGDATVLGDIRSGMMVSIEKKGT